jgi:hypothetical protein
MKTIALRMCCSNVFLGPIASHLTPWDLIVPQQFFLIMGAIVLQQSFPVLQKKMVPKQPLIVRFHIHVRSSTVCYFQKIKAMGVWRLGRPQWHGLS